MSKQGMTLMETIMAMALMSILGGLFVYMYVASTRVFQSEFSRSELRGSGSTALERIGGILREARALDQITATSVTVWQDLNTNANREVDEIIQFSWSGTPGDPLLKTVNAQSVPFLKGVQSFTFSYDVTSKNFQIDALTSQGDSQKSFSSKIHARNL